MDKFLETQELPTLIQEKNNQFQDLENKSVERKLPRWFHHWILPPFKDLTGLLHKLFQNNRKALPNSFYEVSVIQTPKLHKKKKKRKKKSQEN